MTMRFSTEAIAKSALMRHHAVAPLTHYSGIVTLHGLVNLAEITGSRELRNLACEWLKPFYSGEVTKVGGAYDKMYRCGGTASALLVKHGYLPEILPFLVKKAEELINEHPRDSHRLFGAPSKPEKIWIDTVFAVCPFLAVLGNLTGRQDFIDEALYQMRVFSELLIDRENGLYHQAMNYLGPDTPIMSEDHWSRGNGWAALGLAELIVELPENAEMRKLFTDLMVAASRVQDENGLWHQEMTMFDSYVETSGTGFLLYAIGRGLERGVLPNEFRDIFLKGLRGYLGYIALDGSVYHTCLGCLAPGQGRIEDYLNRGWARNDTHAFGPVVLAFGQALRLGITEIAPDAD